jgi:hypothetical protein
MILLEIALHGVMNGERSQIAPEFSLFVVDAGARFLARSTLSIDLGSLEFVEWFFCCRSRIHIRTL